MQKRENLRQIPNKEIYFKVEIDRGVHDFRSLSHLKVTKIVDEARQLTGVLSLFSSGSIKSMSQIITLISQAGPQVLSVIGWIIGESWFHSELDLESKFKDFDSGIEFGEAVYEELHEQGYELSEIIKLVIGIIDHVWERSNVDQEALQKANFIQALKANQNSSEQTSKSSGSDHGKDKDSKN